MAGMHNMMMGMGYGITFFLSNDNYSTEGIVGVDEPYIQWGLLNQDVITDSNQNGQQTQYSWISQSSASPNYWIRVTQNSGSFTYGSSINTWVDTETNPFWGISRSFSGISTIEFTAEISSDSSGTTILASATITLTAIATS